MSRGSVYTVLMLLTSFGVVVGGWFLTREMLNNKKTEILSYSYSYEIKELPDEITVSEDSMEYDIEERFVGVQLSEDTIADILTVWENGKTEIPHESMQNQMNMEQAIDAGKNWIIFMAENGCIPAFLRDCSFDMTEAKLCTLNQEFVNKSLTMSMVSYWQITYIMDDVKIHLKIHALSGQIWKAEISMNESRMQESACTYGEILENAFSFLEMDTSCIYREGAETWMYSVDGRVCAALGRKELAIDDNETVEILTLYLKPSN